MAKRAEHYGHVKISRKAYLPRHLGGDPLWNERRVFSRWEAWEYLIKEAGYAARTFVIENGKAIELGRGETRPLAIRHLMKEWGWGSKKRVSAFLGWGQGEGRLRVQQRTQAGDTYVLCNYDKYQTSGDAGGDRVGTASGDAGGDNKEAVKAGSKETDSTADPDFEIAWRAYPARSGGNPKDRARRAWNARRDEGVEAEALVAGVHRYAAYCTAIGSIGTQYVKQGATFFGPSKHYTEPWTPPANKAAVTEDLLFLVQHTPADATFDLPGTHSTLATEYPARWARAGSVFQALRLAALLELKRNSKALRYEMEQQVKGIANGHG